MGSEVALTYHAVFWGNEHHIFHCCIGAQKAIGTPANDQRLQWQTSVKLKNKSNGFFVFHSHTLHQMMGEGSGTLVCGQPQERSSQQDMGQNRAAAPDPHPGNGWGVPEVVKHLVVDQICSRNI